MSRSAARLGDAIADLSIELGEVASHVEDIGLVRAIVIREPSGPQRVIGPGDLERACERFLTLPEVCERVSLGRTTLRGMIKGGTFPAGQWNGVRQVWLLSEVAQWMRERPRMEDVR